MPFSVLYGPHSGTYELGNSVYYQFKQVMHYPGGYAPDFRIVVGVGEVIPQLGCILVGVTFFQMYSGQIRQGDFEDVGHLLRLGD